MSSFTGAKAVDPRMSENKKTKDNIKLHEQLSFPRTLYFEDARNYACTFSTRPSPEGTTSDNLKQNLE